MDTPLGLLTQEKSITCNKIYKIFDLTHWRPTHYVKVDHARFDTDWHEQIRPHVGYAQLLLWDAFRNGDATQGIEGAGELPNTTWIRRCARHHYYDVDNEKAAQSWHLPEICTAINTVSVMAQWAVVLGFDEIYLLGCDGGYTNGANDHFAKDYYTGVDTQYAERNNKNWNYAHKVIRRSCPIPVYNATVGGSLEIYPRVNMEKILM